MFDVLGGFAFTSVTHPGVFGRRIVVLFIALGAVQWLMMARIVRGQVLSLREKEFVEAAVTVGTGESTEAATVMRRRRVSKRPMLARTPANRAGMVAEIRLYPTAGVQPATSIGNAARTSPK